jgi:NitT/TauT family transport system permease protein
MNIKIKKAIHNRELEALSLLTVIVMWQFAADLLVKNKLFLPSFVDVVLSFLKVIKSGAIYTDLSVSLLHCKSCF